MTITKDALTKFKFTAEGGIAIRLINKTGSNSVKGTVVIADPTNDFSYILSPTSGINPIGVVYENGIPDGNYTWVVIVGIAQVLIENGSGVISGSWAGTSNTVAGRAYSSISPPAAPTHDQELGHYIETKIAGTDVLASAVLHYR
jgi:hypothetical protein